MGARGPLPKPNARRRNKRPAPKGKVKAQRPRCPARLTGEAKAEWQRIVPLLADAGLLTNLDRGMLIRYCEAWEEWIEITETLSVAGRLSKGAYDTVVRSPVWFQRLEIEKLLNDLGKQLFLTPMARLRSGLEHEAMPEPELPESVTAIAEYRKALGG